MNSNRPLDRRATLTRSLVTASLVVAASFASQVATAQQPVADAAAVPAKPSAAALRAFEQQMGQKISLVNQIVERFQSEAAAQQGASFVAADWRRDFGASLLKHSLADLQGALSAANLSTAQSMLYASALNKVNAKHSSDNDLRINSITPCRIVDTRSGGGGQLGPVSRRWEAGGAAATIAAQGGNAAGCGSFSAAQGWLLIVTAVPNAGGTSPNFLTVQHDSGVPTTATLNYVGANVAQFAYTANNNSNVPGGFYAYASSLTHVVIDLIGYSTAATQTNLQSLALDCLGGATLEAVQSIAAAPAAPVSWTSQTCPAGYLLTGTGVWSQLTANTDILHLTTTENYGANRAFCQAYNLSGAAVNAVCTARCCRLPSVNVTTN